MGKIRLFLLTLVLSLNALCIKAWTNGDTISIYYPYNTTTDYFLGSNDYGTAISSSAALSSEYFLWRAESSGSQWKFKNIATGKYLAVTTSGSTVKLTLSSSAALFYFTSSTTTTGKLYYKYKSKNYYIRYNGGYSMSTSNSYNVLSFNRFKTQSEENLTYTTPGNLQWGYHETGTKATYFSVTLSFIHKFQGQDEPSQSVLKDDTEIITKPEELRARGVDVVYVISKNDNIIFTWYGDETSVPGCFGFIGDLGSTASTTDELWDGTAKDNYYDIINVEIKYKGRTEKFDFYAIQQRFFLDNIHEMEMEVVPGSYSFAASEATASSDYGWVQQFDIIRKVTDGNVIRYADGSVFQNYASTVYLDEDIWAEKEFEYNGETMMIQACPGCTTLIAFEDGTRFEEVNADGTTFDPATDKRDKSTFYVSPTGNNTSSSIYTDVIHIKHRYEYYNGSASDAYPKKYPDYPEYPGAGPDEKFEPDPLDYPDGTSDPDYRSALEEYNNYLEQKALYDAALSDYYDACAAVEAEKLKDEYYVHSYVNISQLNTASMAEDRFISQKGASGRDFTLVGKKNIQSVHETKSTIYCIPGENTKLTLRSKDFFGWMRWFDYNEDFSVTTLYGNSLWNTKPTATASGKSYEFINIGNEYSLLSRGQYYAYGHSPFPSSQPSFNVPIITTPSQGVLDAQEAANKALLPMDIACDVSNYTDFSFSTIAGAHIVEGPTLSYRQVFQLRHADEMVAKMNSHRYASRSDLSKDPSWNLNKDGNYLNNEYLEEHVCIAPAGRNISITTDYKYKYYSHDSELGYIYISTATGDYTRVGKSSEETAEWYKNGEKATLGSGEAANDATQIGYVNTTTCFLVLNPHVMPTGKTVDTVIYTLATKNYKIARYVVIYQPLDVIGPIAESGAPATAIITDYDIENKYEVLARCTFDPPLDGSDTKTKPDGNGNPYPKPGITAYRVHNVPLAWEECSYGFCYSRPDIQESHNKRNTASADVAYGEKNQRITGGSVGGGIFPYWGEYMLINKLHEELNGGYIINTIEQRGGAANGYMLYCDGTEEPGLVASLNVNSKLCAGQKMFCSAWINNVTKNYNSKSELPKFRFVVEGKMANVNDWNVVTEYLSGDLGHKSGWCQIVFPIDLRYEYDEYRIKIYNFANTSIGNDFAIDDIRIYATPLAVSAYQTSTSCSPSEGYSGVDVQAMVRIDYLGLMDDSFFDRDIYYQIYDNTEDTPLDGSYIGGRTDYGKFHLPVKGYNHKTSDPTHCYTSLEKFVDAHNANPTIKYGWVWEHIKDEERYVLYIAADIDPDALPAWRSSDDVLIYVATTPEDFGFLSCSMSSTLPIKDKLFVYIDDEPQKPDYCPNLRHKLEMHVYDYNVADASIVDAEGRCLNDWLIISSDFSYTEAQRIGSELVSGVDIFASEHYGYSYKQVVQAILDMRREPTIEVPNANVLAKSLAELVPEDFLDPVNWTIISTLIKNGMLIIGKQSINPYLPESGLDFMVFPIVGTAKNIVSPFADMNICFSPQRAVLNTWESQLKLHIGKKAFNDYTLAERINPYVQRVSKIRLTSPDSLVYIPQHDRKYVNIVKVELESSDDAEFNPATQWYGFETEKTCCDDYYSEGVDLIKLRKKTTPPAGKTRFSKFKSGKTYTFCLTWQDRTDTRPIHLPSSALEPQHEGAELNCAPGFSYVSLCIVPDTMVWVPAPNMGDSWFTDENWQEADKTTGLPKGAGFIPLAETHVIIPNIWTERYPQIDPGSDPEKVPEAHQILFRDSAMIFGQNLLRYDTAYVDMRVPSARWTIISPALQNTYSGDMYIPTGTDGKLFAPGALNDNRSAYPFWQSFYNHAVMQENEDNELSDVIYSTEWGPFANTLGAEYQAGTGYGLLGFDDTDAEDNPLIIRLPKKATKYYYFKSDGTQVNSRYVEPSRVNDGRFAYNPDATLTINVENPGRYFVFGNPTMAFINMNKFLKANTNLKPTFYYMDQGSLGVYNSLTSTDATEHLLAPMRGVIVELAGSQPDATELTITLNNTMLATTTDPDPALVLHAPRRIEGQKNAIKLLHITAQNGSNVSKIVIGEHHDFSNDFTEEDSRMLAAGAGANYSSSRFNTSINLYSSCGSEALSIDLRKQITVVPISMYFPNESERKAKTEITFNGLDKWDSPVYFCDLKTDAEIELFDGMTLDIETPENNESRYYIMAQRSPAVITDVPVIEEQEKILPATIDFITNNENQLIVVGSEPVNEVRIYDPTGKLIKISQGDRTASGKGMFVTISLQKGVYVATATAGSTTQTKCVVIK